MAEHGIRFRDVVAAQCPFCGAKGKVRCESRRREIWRNGLGDVCEYRTYHIRCTVCNARGATAGGQCVPSERTVKIYGTETLVHSYKYYHDKAAEAWNRRSDNG